MLESLYIRPYTLAAHNAAPCVESRKRFLLHRGIHANRLHSGANTTDLMLMGRALVCAVNTGTYVPGGITICKPLPFPDVA
jgi:hypothetical protein